MKCRVLVTPSCFLLRINFNETHNNELLIIN